MSAKAPVRGGGELGKNGQRWSQTVKSIKLVRVSEGTFRARFLMRNSGFDLVCLLVYGIPTFDSESFEL